MTRSLWRIARDIAIHSADDNIMRMSAAVAYYAVFSLAPLAVIALVVAGLAFGEQAARERLFDDVTAAVGPGASKWVEQVVTSSAQLGHGFVAVTISAVLLLAAASRVVGGMQSGLHEIWRDHRTTGNTVGAYVVGRLLVVAATLVLGGLLLALLLAGATFRFIRVELLSDASWLITLEAFASPLVALGLYFLLFCVISKILLPSLRWGQAAASAATTALLFEAGSFALTFYFAHSAALSIYGAAGSMVLVLLWVHYSAMAFFLGAEVARALSIPPVTRDA